MSRYEKFTGTVLAEQEGRLLIVSFNRPERLNAVGGDLGQQFEEVLALASDDPSVGAILLRGEGRAFCVGGDVQSFDEQAKAAPAEARPPAARPEELMRHGAKILDHMLAVPQPIVAAVQGYAMGLGCTIALFCDVVVAADTAQFADTHVNVGLVAGDGGAIMFPLLMSFGAAKWYLMTGDRISGTEAARIGMVLKSVPEAELLEEGKRLATRLANGAPLAVRGTKSTLNRILRSRLDLVLEHGLLLEGATFTSEDHKEASAAFVEKRTPVFRGR